MLNFDSNNYYVLKFQFISKITRLGNNSECKSPIRDDLSKQS